MTKPFEKFDKKLDDKESKAYLAHSQKLSAKNKELSDKKALLDSLKDEINEKQKLVMEAELRKLENEKHKIEGELLKHKEWIEIDMGNHIKEMMETNPQFSETLKYAFVQTILENPDPAKKEFYNNAYKEFNKDISREKSTASDLIFMLQMLLVECHEQTETLKGFKIKDLVTYGKLDRFYDGILGGRTLRAMWNVAFADYEGFPSSSEANFADPVYMKGFVDKVVSICGGSNVVPGVEPVREDEVPRKELSTNEISTIDVKKIGTDSFDGLISSIFDEVPPVMTAEQLRVANRAGRAANVIHRVGGSMDPINPETVWKMETTPSLNLDYAKQRAAQFVELFGKAGPEAIEANFNKQEMMAKFFQIVRDFMKLGHGLSFRDIRVNIFRLTVLKEILKNPAVKDFMGKLNLQETEQAYSGGSVGLDRWKNYLQNAMGHQGGITPELVDTMMERFESAGKL